MTDDLAIGDDGKARCFWGGSSPEYATYHDTEWGRVLRGDDAIFERMCLEGFQSGLSWITILRKRPAFRAAFSGFLIAKVAEFGDADVQRLLGDAGIVRNRAKILASVANAKTARGLKGGLSDLVWSFAPAEPGPAPTDTSQVPATTAESAAMAKALKKAGFAFVGPTTCYALMQACGLVDDHLADCHARRKTPAVPASAATPATPAASAAATSTASATPARSAKSVKPAKR